MKYHKAYYVFYSILGMIVFLSDAFIRTKTQSISPITNFIFQYITRLGDGIYCVSLVLIGFLMAYYFNTKKRFEILTAFFHIASAMIIGAIIVNMLKIFIGRARPKFFNEVGAYHFQPFHIDYDFASFPSGHAITWGIVAMAMARFFPKYRLYWYLSAIMVALSRVVLGSHYTSDVFASLGLSYVIVDYCVRYCQMPYADILKKKLII